MISVGWPIAGGRGDTRSGQSWTRNHTSNFFVIQVEGLHLCTMRSLPRSVLNEQRHRPDEALPRCNNCAHAAKQTMESLSQIAANAVVKLSCLSRMNECHSGGDERTSASDLRGGRMVMRDGSRTRMLGHLKKAVRTPKAMLSSGTGWAAWSPRCRQHS